MSNNPGKAGKPAPWIKQADEAERQAKDNYLLEHHADYAAWRERRSVAFRGYLSEEEALDKAPFSNGANKKANKRLSAWDKVNTNPMSWEEFQRLSGEFKSQYVRRNFA